MWDSTVFLLRNSFSAISLIGHAVGDQLGDLELALGERAEPGVVGRGRAARLGARAQLAQLAARLVAHAQRAARVGLALGLAQGRDRVRALAAAARPGRGGREKAA